MRNVIALTLLFLFAAACTKHPSSQRVVNLGIWSNYLTPEAILEFEKRSGIHVQVSNYSSNEELLAKLQAGGSDFDVLVPSDYMVFAMVRLGLLRALDLKKLAHAQSLDPRFLKKSFDPKNEYSLPYDWGTTGIAVNRTLYGGEVRGWKDLFEKPDLSAKISLLDDPREVIGAALKAQGFSLNSRSKDELAKAQALLMRARSRVKLFTSETLGSLTHAETSASQAYVTDALQARRATGGKIAYILPEEGGTLWLDNLVVPAQAPHPEEALILIDYLLEPKTVVTAVTQLFVSPANSAAIPLLPMALRADPLLFPTEIALKKFEMIEDLGELSAVWDRVWTEFKASL
jgi:spermidine/putrescine transport system substrate-binding protein